MLTDEQKREARRLTQYIEREGLVSVMNDTKWRRVFSCLEPIQGWLGFQRKDVREPEPQGDWCGDLYHVLGGWNNIEWLDIRAVRTIRQGALIEVTIEDHTTELVQAIRGAGVPFSRFEGLIRIWGYLRPGVSPRWRMTTMPINNSSVWLCT